MLVYETVITNTLPQCSPAIRVWPGQKCEHCEIKGLPCSESTTSRLGRPPNSRTSDHKLDLAVPQEVNDSSPGADAADGQSDYAKLYVAIMEGFGKDADYVFSQPYRARHLKCKALTLDISQGNTRVLEKRLTLPAGDQATAQCGRCKAPSCACAKGYPYRLYKSISPMLKSLPDLTYQKSNSQMTKSG